MMRILLFLSLAVCCTGAFAQKQKQKKQQAPAPAAKAAPTFPIVSLKVDGNKQFTDEQILELAGLKLGQEANTPLFEAARERLTSSGFFETVGYKYGPSTDNTGYAAVFLVAEVEQVYPVRFERLPKSPEEWKTLLRKTDPMFGDRIPGTAPVLAHFGALLTKAVGEKVVGRVSPDNSGELAIVFQPAQMPPSVAEVIFTGNSVLQQDALRNAIAGAAVGAVWEEKRFRQILDAGIRPLYEARGRIRVAFPKVTSQPVADVNGVKVTVEIVEGEVFTLSEVEVEGTTSTRELMKAGDLKTGDIANFDEIKAGVERMRKLVRSNGYLNAKATTRRDINDDKKQVKLTVAIQPGERYQFGKLEIQGLDILTEPIIRKIWTMKAGQPFNPDYPDYFLDSVRAEGIFDNLGKTRSVVKVDEQTKTADVTLVFTGDAPPKKKSPIP
jgi:outer membrane protein assembly factor BamA